jgi:integrase
VVPNHALYQAKLRPEIAGLQIHTTKNPNKKKPLVHHFYPPYAEGMPETQKEESVLFEKVGECLYRYQPSGGYYARIKTAGKEIRRSLKTTDKHVAKTNLADLRKELGLVDLSEGRITLSELCDRYLQTVKHQKPSTVAAKQRAIRRMKKKWPGGSLRQLRDIKPSEVRQFLSTEGSRGGKSLYNHHVLVARAVFQMAVDDKLIWSSPAAGIKQVKRDKPVRRTPSFEEFQRIVSDVRAQVYNADCADSADFIELLGLAGLGQAEASSLTWGDVDWDRQQITTFRHKTSTGFVVPIYPQLRPLLKRLRGDSDPSPNKRVLKISDAKKALAGACERLNLPRYSQRSLRRMFITRASEKGVDVKVIAEWQGHTDGGKLILDTYSHVTREHAKNMAALMTW